MKIYRGKGFLLPESEAPIESHSSPFIINSNECQKTPFSSHLF
jgi:hypothetical protein